MSLPVGLRVSSRFTAHGQHHQADARFDRSASIASSSAVLRANLSGLVTVSTSPSRVKVRHSVSVTRLAVLDTYSPNMRSAPADLASARCSGLGEVARPISGASVFCLLQ